MNYAVILTSVLVSCTVNISWLEINAVNFCPNCLIYASSQFTSYYVQHGYVDLGCQVARAIKFCTEEYNICGSSVWISV